MEIDKFVDINLIKVDDMIILEFVVRHSIPTPLQWIIAIDEVKQHLQNLKEANINFGFLFDIQKIGLVSLNHMSYSQHDIQLIQFLYHHSCQHQLVEF